MTVPVTIKNWKIVLLPLLQKVKTCLQLLSPTVMYTIIHLFTLVIENELKMNISNLEPHKPTGTFSKNPITKRSFDSDYYHLKNQISIIHTYVLCTVVQLKADKGLTKTILKHKTPTVQFIASFKRQN